MKKLPHEKVNILISDFISCQQKRRLKADKIKITVNIWVKQEHLIGEDLTIEIWDNDKMTGDDYCKVMNVKACDGNLIPLTLDSYIKGKAGNWANLYVRIGAPKLKLANENNIFKSQNRLDIQDKKEIYSAQNWHTRRRRKTSPCRLQPNKLFLRKSRGVQTEKY